jgi:hypothetical protein
MVKTTAKAAPVEPAKKSPKAKESRGVPAGMKTCWAPVSFSDEERTRLVKVAKQKGVTLPALLVGLCLGEVAARKAEFDKLAEEHDLKNVVSEADALKHLEKIEREMERAKQLLEALRAKSAAKEEAV